MAASQPSLSIAGGAVADWGDFVDSEDEDEVEAEAEVPNRYSQGIYFPICLGDILVDRYRVEHKLGHGGFSTVWMAHDTLSRRDVALKIIKPGYAGERELSVNNEILASVKDCRFLLLYQDTFVLRGPPGHTHRVLIFPVQGPNFRDYARQTPFAARMSPLLQLSQGLKSLPDAGFVHRGSSADAYPPLLNTI